MSKRDKILIIVMLLFFGGSGYILYTGLFADQVQLVTQSAPDTEANKQTIVNLLPYGNKLDTSIIQDRGKSARITTGNIYLYPSLNKEDYSVNVYDMVGIRDGVSTGIR